jgi:hypothetical protein
MKIERDKILHLIAGALGEIPSFMFCTHNEWNTYLSILFIVVLGGIKELVYDWWWKRGIPDWWDFLCTVIGGMVVMIIFLIF